MKIPSFIFAVLCAGSITGAGFSGEYFRHNDVYATSGSSVGAVMGFIMLAAYFLYAGIRQIAKENNADESKKV